MQVPYPQYIAQAGSNIRNPALSGNLQNETGIGFFQQFLPNLVSLALIVGALIFFFVLILGAIQWITSGGDKANTEAARGKITAGLVGIIILFSVFALVKVAEGFFGVNITNIDIGPLILR